MTTIVVTTENWNDATFWEAVSLSDSREHTLDLSALPSNFFTNVSTDAGTGNIAISDGSTIFLIGDSQYTGPSQATLQGPSHIYNFTTVLGGQGEAATGNDADNVWVGSGEGEMYTGGPGMDNIYAGGGNDTISARDGDDRIYAGAGNDSVEGNLGDDLIYGEAGVDTIHGGDGNDTIDAGDDTISVNGGMRADTIDGGTGDDVITIENVDASGSAEKGFVAGGDGSDTINVIDSNIGSLYGSDVSGGDIGGAGYDTFSVSGNSEIGKIWTGFSSDPTGGKDVINISDSSLVEMVEIGPLDQVVDINISGSGQLGTATSDTSMGAWSGAQNISVTDDGVINSSVTFSTGEGNDTLSFSDNSSAKTALDAGSGDDVITFSGSSSTEDMVLGGDGNDTIVIEDNALARGIISGNTGDDSIIGGVADNVIHGGSGNDTLRGGDGDDYLQGDDGNDSIDGGVGDDSIYSGTGDDSVNAGEGADLIYGWTGQDSLSGGAGNDTIDGGIDDDYVDGGGDDDDDVLYGGDGHDTLYGGEGNDEIGAGVGNDVIFGGEGSDTLYGDVGDDTIDGGDGDDTISGGVGSDSIVGGLGADYILGGDDADAIQGGAGEDTIYGDAGNDTIDGGGDKDTLYGGAGNDSLSGGEGNDLIYANEGDDTLIGGDGNDYLSAGDDDDLIEGGVGNDHIDSGYGNDTADGGAGDDADDIKLNAGEYTDGTVVQVDGGTDGIDIDLLNLGDWVGYRNLEETTDADGDSTSGSVELLDANGNWITLNFSEIEAIILPPANLTPNYIVHGTSGNDTIDVNYVGDSQGDMIDANDAADGSNDDEVVAGSGDDRVLTGVGDDIVYGGAGNDTVYGGDNNDHLDGNNGDDLLYGEAGDDLLHGGADNDSIDGGDGDDQLAGEDGDDTLHGGAGDDTLDGGEGDDSIGGEAGDDVIRLSDSFGNDTIVGGETSETLGDTLDLSGLTTGVTVDLTDANSETGTVSDGTSTAEFTEIENIILGGGRDTVVLADGSGAHTVQGFSMYHSGDGTTVDQLDVSGLTSDGGTTPINTADVTVTDTNGDGTGDAILTFPGGESITLIDVLPGQVATRLDLVAIGIPTVPKNFIVEGAPEGGWIHDSYTDPEGDRIDSGDNEAGNDDDLVHGSDGVDNVVAGNGNDTVIAGGGDDNVSGGIGDDSLVGGAGNDGMEGNDGNDTLLGGDGNDALYGDGDDDYIDGGAGNDIITGDEGSDMMIGGAGDDTVYGYYGVYGDDTLIGGETEETTGDRVDYSLIWDNFAVTYTGEEAGTITTDGHKLTFSEIEEIKLSRGEDTIIGSAGTQNVSTGRGADIVTGGAGDDIFDIGADDGAQDTVVFGDDDGNDTISGFEAPVYDPVTDTYTGHDQVDVSGLTDAKGAQVNVHDVTVSDDGSGNAVLTFPNGESITLDQVSPSDLSTPAQLAAIGIPMSDDIVSGTSGADLIDSDYIGDPEGDMVDAGDNLAGNDDDVIHAGDGNDTVYSGAGNDSIDGGEGNDIIYGDTSGGSTEELLADGSFEEFKPAVFSQGGSLPDWYSWNPTTPDLSEEGGYEAPWSDTAAPTDGTNYVTLVTTPDGSHREGLSQDLATPLTAGTTYTITLDAAAGETANSASAGEPTSVLIYGNPTAGVVATDDAAGPAGSVLLGSAEVTTDFNSGTMQSVTITFTPTTDIATLSISLDDPDLNIHSAALVFDNISLTEATSNDTLDGGAGDDVLVGGGGNDTFIMSSGNDTIGDFNTGNTGALDDGDQGNNDLVDLSDYYDNIFDLRADQADDGVLNHSNTDVDYSGKVALGGANTLTLTGVDAQDLTFDNTNVTCFTTGTTIRTPDGDRKIETLRVGDLVNTADNGPQPIRWIGMRRLDEKDLSASENLRPVLIDAHVLGNTKPLIVSQQHGMLIDGSKLARAKHLAETVPGVRIMQGKKSVCYVHLMFDTHQIIFAENAASESFYPGPMALKALDQDARAELFTLFPELELSNTVIQSNLRARSFVKKYEIRRFCHIS